MFHKKIKIMKKLSKYRIVFITTENKIQASQIGRKIVEEKLAACCSIIDGVSSVFEWNDEIVERSECILMIKTTENSLSALQKKVTELHSDDVPEFIAVNIENGSEKYLQWLEETIKVQD